MVKEKICIECYLEWFLISKNKIRRLCKFQMDFLDIESLFNHILKTKEDMCKTYGEIVLNPEETKFNCNMIISVYNYDTEKQDFVGYEKPIHLIELPPRFLVYFSNLNSFLNSQKQLIQIYSICETYIKENDYE